MKKLSLFTMLACAPTNLSVFSEESNQILAQPNVAQQDVMTKQQAAKIIEKVGFPKKVVPMLTCLAEHESHFKVNAINENLNHTRDYGLLQVNSVWLKKNGCNTTVHNLLDPENNAKCAYKIYTTQGLSAWTTYKMFRNSCQNYKLDGSQSENMIASKLS